MSEDPTLAARVAHLEAWAGGLWLKHRFTDLSFQPLRLPPAQDWEASQKLIAQLRTELAATRADFAEERMRHRALWKAAKELLASADGPNGIPSALLDQLENVVEAGSGSDA